MADVRRTIQDAASALRAGRTTSVELVQQSIERADRVDDALGSFLERFDDAALEDAAAADAALAAGLDRGPLHGMPVGIKDVIASRGGPTTAQSVVLDPDWGRRHGDAPSVARLRAAGAVVLGKTTTMEFACGMPDPTKPFPVPRNPWDLRRWAGGSSSGSASGIAAGLFLGALGTDTGGSIRSPSSFCGITGLKPTYGLVPTSGTAPLGTSLDHVGPMARSAWDCAAMLQALAGPHASDMTTIEIEVPDYLAALTGSIEGLRIGVDRRNTVDRPGADSGMIDRFEEAIDVLQGAGASVVDIDIPFYDELVAVARLTLPSEVFAYHRPTLQRRWEEYGSGTRLLMAMGALIGAGDLQRIHRVREHARRAVLALFETVDLIVSPTTLAGAPLLDGMRMEDLKAANHLAPAWNAVGLPALSVPMGMGGDTTPVGLQIVGAPLADARVLQAGDAFQRITDHHLRVPTIPDRPAPPAGLDPDR